MSTTSVTNCPICGSEKINPLFNCTDHTVTNESFTIAQCEVCELSLTSPRPAEDSIGSYYLSDNYISHSGGGKNIFDRIYVLARGITLRWKKNILEKNTTGQSLLDVGCGTGNFLSFMNKNRWYVEGVEPSPLARKTAENQIGKKILADIKQVEKNDFDAITLWHVLEHLYDPNAVLQSLKSRLKDSGTIFIAVPNHKAYDALHYQQNWAGYDVPRHLWHFSPDNMKTLLKKNGYSLVTILPMRLDSFYVSLLSEGYIHPARNKFLNAISALYRGLKSNVKASSTKNYSSLIYIATK